MNTERLLRLAAHLDTVPVDEFKMDHWAERDDVCGTVCCAMGHACDLPEFAAAGLFLEWGEHGRGRTAELCRRTDAPHLAPHLFTGFRAAAVFFSLSCSVAEDLFSPDCYPAKPGPGDVAARIRELVAKGTVPE